MFWLRRFSSTPAFDFHGLSIHDFTASGGPASASVAEILVSPGTHHAKAKSLKSDKIYVCLEGTARFEVDGKTTVLKEHDVLIIGKETWFSYTNESGTPARLLLIHVPPFDLSAEVFWPAETHPRGGA